MKLGNVKEGTHKMWQPEEEWSIIDRLLAMVDVSVRLYPNRCHPASTAIVQGGRS
jgi:hypothetical protein